MQLQLLVMKQVKYKMQKVLSNENFKVVLAKGIVDDELEKYFDHMKSLKAYQFYLNEGSFKILNDFYSLCRSLEKADPSILNPAQKSAVDTYKEQISVKNFAAPATFDDGGTSLKRINPNGFIAVSTILVLTMTTGLFIALALLSKIPH